MAYDEILDARVRDVAAAWGAVRKAMFGGTGYLLQGNLFAGVYKERLLIRVSAEEGDELLRRPGVLAFDMVPRPMPGWVMIGEDQLEGDGLERWMDRGRRFALALPPK